MRVFVPVLVVLAIGLVVLLYVWATRDRSVKGELTDARDRLELALDALHRVRDEVQLQIDAQHPDLYLLRTEVQESLMKIATLKRKELTR